MYFNDELGANYISDSCALGFERNRRCLFKRHCGKSYSTWHVYVRLHDACLTRHDRHRGSVSSLSIQEHRARCLNVVLRNEKRVTVTQVVFATCLSSIAIDFWFQTPEASISRTIRKFSIRLAQRFDRAYHIMRPHIFCIHGKRSNQYLYLVSRHAGFLPKTALHKNSI